MPLCQAFACNHRSGGVTRKSMFQFPNRAKNPERFKKWATALSIDKFLEPTYEWRKYDVVCEDHFTSDCFENDMRAKIMGYEPKKKTLKPDAVPSIIVKPPKETASTLSRKASHKSKRQKAAKNREETLLFCDACDKGYHMVCHQPPLQEKPSGNWVCALCIKEDEEMDYSSSNGLPEENQPSDTDRNPSTSKTNSPSLSNGNKYDSERPITDNLRRGTTEVATANQSRTANLPEQSAKDSIYPEIEGNLAKWNVDQVADYFKLLGFVAEYTAFKEQEIDGRSLLLLRRIDILTGLSFKLGPALKVYKHVSRLQLHHNAVLEAQDAT